jgi:hypothetical protein
MLTLYTTPVVYLYLERLRRALGGAPAAGAITTAHHPGQAPARP